MVSVRRVAPVLLLVIAIPALAASKKASSTHPPRGLHRAGDHWTAYNPPDPSTYPAGAKTYAIKSGDTLWGLAQRNLKNAYLWPQLWEANTWITDAHWIYPGDTILLSGEGGSAVAASTAASGAATTGSSTGSSSTAAMIDSTNNSFTGVSTGDGTTPVVPVVTGPPVPLATEVDIYCYGYIGDANEPMPNRIASYEDIELRHQVGAVEQVSGGSEGDLLFIDGGSATGLAAGDTYIVVEPGAVVRHPLTGKVVGQMWDFRGQIRILCTEANRSRAMITQSCEDIHVGARLKPMPQIPIPLARIPDLPAFCDPSSGKPSGTIISSQDFSFGLAEGNLIQIDMGSEDQIQPGDFLTVWRDSPVKGQPRQILGEVGVLTTENHTATAKVVQMRRGMSIGDRVELR